MASARDFPSPLRAPGEERQSQKERAAREKGRGHDGLCVRSYVEAHSVVRPPTEGQIPAHCWCRCPRCWFPAAARCVCSHCSCHSGLLSVPRPTVPRLPAGQTPSTTYGTAEPREAAF